ncbi:hypothetical protein [uncultured Chryseobacterium sp.]|uniref:hypothetical protein n=1 Tax=uncultured Chryseobacterium sp. TaxID=259322 RepID=UPI0025D6E0BC|nr:hypothetical protein [uncultured Chryseobacterium sp.]
MNKLIKFLDQFDYTYEIIGNSIFVSVDRTFKVEIKFNSNSTIISHKKKSWTMLGGFNNIRFEITLIFNSIFLAVFFLLLLFEVEFISYEIKMIIMFLNIIFYSWFFYYLIKFEVFKSKVEEILFENI